MDLLEVVDGLPVFHPQVMVMKEFAVLVKRDKTKGKSIAVKELAFIFFHSDYNTVYENLVGDEKIDEIKKHLDLPEKWKFDKFMEAALERYEKLMYTPSIGLLETAKKGVRKVDEFIEDVDLTEQTKSGGLVFSPKELQMVIKDIPNTVEALNKVEKIIKKELQDKKGSREESLGLIELKKAGTNVDRGF